MDQSHRIVSMYKFVRLDDYVALRDSLADFCMAHALKGTILLADEGINGTVSGYPEAVEALLAYLRADSRFADLEFKESYADLAPFQRMKVKLRKEIVSLGQAGAAPFLGVGIYIEPKDWNEFIRDPDVVVLDTRNQYEHRIGTFKNAISPETVNFRNFPDYVQKKLPEVKNKKVALFCTGGIRCEKASAYMLAQGYNEVYQLKGGILSYLEQVDSQDSLWEGECFVFDSRVAVDSRLSPGSYSQCFACRQPLSHEDMESKHYQKGVSCPYCIDEKTEQKRAGFRERQYQMELAQQRRDQ